MSLHQIWDFIQKARNTNVSMAKLALIKETDRESGVKRGSVFLWQRKLLSLYKQDSSLSFLGVRKLSMVSDSSHHSTKDWLVSLFYNSSANCFAHATAQFVNSAKNLRPGQFELLPEVERLAARREVEESCHPQVSPGCQQSVLQDCQAANVRFPATLSAVVHVGPVEAGRPGICSW